MQDSVLRKSGSSPRPKHKRDDTGETVLLSAQKHSTEPIVLVSTNAKPLYQGAHVHSCDIVEEYTLPTQDSILQEEHEYNVAEVMSHMGT